MKKSIIRNFFYKGRKNKLQFEYEAWTERTSHGLGIIDANNYKGEISITRKKHEKHDDPDFGYYSPTYSFEYSFIIDDCSQYNGFTLGDYDKDDVVYILGALRFMESLNIATPETIKVSNEIEKFIQKYFKPN